MISLLGSILEVIEKLRILPEDRFRYGLTVLFVSTLGDLDCILSSESLKSYLPFANGKDLTQTTLYSSYQIR